MFPRIRLFGTTCSKYGNACAECHLTLSDLGDTSSDEEIETYDTDNTLENATEIVDYSSAPKESSSDEEVENECTVDILKNDNKLVYNFNDGSAMKSFKPNDWFKSFLNFIESPVVDCKGEETDKIIDKNYLEYENCISSASCSTPKSSKLKRTNCLNNFAGRVIVKNKQYSSESGEKEIVHSERLDVLDTETELDLGHSTVEQEKSNTVINLDNSDTSRELILSNTDENTAVDKGTSETVIKQDLSNCAVIGNRCEKEAKGHLFPYRNRQDLFSKRLVVKLKRLSPNEILRWTSLSNICQTKTVKEDIKTPEKSDTFSKQLVVKVNPLSPADIFKYTLRSKMVKSDSEMIDFEDNESLDESFLPSYTTLVELSSDKIDVNKIKDSVQEFKDFATKFFQQTKNIDIPISWELPDIHKTPKGLWRVKTKDRKDVTKGRLNSEEILYLEQRLKRFCNKYKLDICTLRQVSKNNYLFKYSMSNEMRIKFLQYLAKDLDNRTPLTVYLYLTRLGLRKGKFSSAEDQFLIDMYNNYNGKNLHSMCGLLLNRCRSNIFRRLKRLKEKKIGLARPTIPKKHRHLSDTLLPVLNSILKSKNSMDLNSVLSKFSKNMWISIANQNNISPALAKGLFVCYLWPQILADHPIYYYSLCSRLIVRIHGMCHSWKDIKWQSLAKEMHNVSPLFLYVLLRNIVKKNVPPQLFNDFDATINYLMDKVVPQFEQMEKCGNDVALHRIIIKD